MPEYIKLAPSSLTRQSVSASSQAILSMNPGAAVWKTRDYAQFAREGYIDNSDAYACITLIADNFAGIRIFPYILDGKQKQKELKDGPLVDLLRQPNPDQAWTTFSKGLITYLLCSGNSYVERSIGTRPTNPPLRMYLQRPDWMQVEKGDQYNPVRGFSFIPGLRMNSVKEVLWPGDEISGRGLVQRIKHLKFFHPLDSNYGLSPMEAAARSIDQNNEAQSWNLSMLQNGMRPSGALVVDGNMGDDQKRDLKDSIGRKHTGAANVGKTLLLEGASASYMPFGMNAIDMSWIEGQRLATRRICSVFKVPSMLIGDEQARTYSNFGEARKALYMECILPLLDFICIELSTWLAPFFGDGIRIGYDRNDIEAIQEDRQVVHSRAVEAWNAGLVTLNKSLEMMGESTVPEGEVYKIPTTSIIVPAGSLGKAPAPISTPPRPGLVPQPTALPATAPKTPPKRIAA